MGYGLVAQGFEEGRLGEVCLGCCILYAKLLQKTLELKPVPGGFPCFIVTDLFKDARFNQLPFVTGPPFFKYYPGTPLTTENEINIGSLFILDVVARPVLTAKLQAFLGSIAQVVVDHMEVFRESEERKKVMRILRGGCSAGIASFSETVTLR